MNGKGFTLLETVAALLILAITFGFLTTVLSSAVKNLGYRKNQWEDFKHLDNHYKCDNLTTLSVKTARISKYGFALRIYTYGGQTFYEVLP